MSRSSDRGVVEPYAALAAVLALTAALGVYGVAHASLPLDPSPSTPAHAALERVADALGPGPTDPAALAAAVGPRRVNATLSTADRTWRAGPPVPPGADSAATPLPVRVSNRTVRPGRLRVWAWR
ncbi:MAG: hypothetical protein ABEJ80_00015 [Halarchaeum sp.]